MRRIIVFFTLVKVLTAYLSHQDQNCLNSLDLNSPRLRAVNIHINRSIREITLEVRMVRHHIIPYRVLRQFYNGILSIQNDDLQNRLFAFIGSLGRVAGVNVEIDRQTFIRDRFEREIYSVPHRYLNTHSENLEGPVERENFNTFVAQSLIMWMPFNIFEGPRSRSDEPGENFEVNSNHIVGETIYHDLVRLNQYMQNFIQNHHPNDGTTALRTMEELLVQRPAPFQFNRAQWHAQHIFYYYQIEQNIFRIRNLDDPNDPEDVYIIEYDQRKKRETSVKTKVKFQFNSTVRIPDFACIDSTKRIRQGLTNGNLIYYKLVIWDLEEIHLLQANNLIKSVKSFITSQHSDWQQWLQSNQNLKLSDQHNLFFRDTSFVIEYRTHCDDGVTECLGAMIFDKTSRVVAKIRQTKSNYQTRILIYQHNNWHPIEESNNNEWYKTFQVDEFTPQFDLPANCQFLPTNEGGSGGKIVHEIFSKDECILKSQIGGAVSGAIAGASIGTILFPGIGTVLGWLIGATGVGLLSGVAIGSVAC